MWWCFKLEWVYRHGCLCASSTSHIRKVVPSNYFNSHDWFFPRFHCENFLSIGRKTKIIVIQCSFTWYDSSLFECVPIPLQVRMWATHFSVWVISSYLSTKTNRIGLFLFHAANIETSKKCKETTLNKDLLRFFTSQLLFSQCTYSSKKEWGDSSKIPISF